MGLWVPAVLPKTCGFAVWVQVKHAAGMDFAGTGAGWTSLTCAVPVCHPMGMGTVLDLLTCANTVPVAGYLQVSATHYHT